MCCQELTYLSIEYNILIAIYSLSTKYKNYDNDNFDFKIFVQDILSGTEEDIKFARQLSAFFVEPNGNEFYQISVAAGSYAVNKGYKLLKDIKNYEEDEIIKGLETNLKLIMDNIIYK